MPIPPFLAKYGIYIGLALVVAGILALAYCEGHKAGQLGEVVHEQARTIQTQQDVGAANENASTARVADATKGVQQEKELTDALKSSNNPDRQRIARGCAILRQQGRSPKNLPIACGSSTSH